MQIYKPESQVEALALAGDVLDLRGISAIKVAGGLRVRDPDLNLEALNE